MSPRDDRDLIERQLRPWLAEEGMVREPKDLFERVASGTRGVRQRPAWLVRLLGNGLVGTGAGPAARWREHRMATALGLGTIVVVAALAVGSLGPGQPTGVVPGAVTESPSPSASPEYMVEVTGDFTREDVQSYGSTTEEDGIYHTRGPWWKITWEASDPRLSGAGTYVSNWNEVVASGLSYGADNYILVNQDGRWAGTSLVFGSPGDDELLVLQGEGAYEGLTAYVQIPATSGQKSFNAIITNGESVEIPEPVEPPAE